MSVKPPDVTLTIDAVGDRLAIQFPSGAQLSVGLDATIEVPKGGGRPTEAEVRCLTDVLRKVCEPGLAAAVERWAA